MKNLVFIVGAGASRPFGLPLGTQLLTQTCDKLTRDASALVRCVVAAGYSPSEVRELESDLRYWGTRSIDAYLQHADSRKRRLAKLVIVLMIREAEQRATIFPASAIPDHWIQALFDELSAGSGVQTTIVSFNYDLLVERYLEEVIVARSIASRADASREMRRLVKINHVHGSVPARWYGSTEDAIAKSVRRSPASVDRAVKVIPDVEPDSPGFKRARIAIERADLLAVLGFGFHDTNCIRLGIARSTSSRTRGFRRAVSTTKGFSSEEWGILTRRLRSDLALPLLLRGNQYSSITKAVRAAFEIVKRAPAKDKGR